MSDYEQFLKRYRAGEPRARVFHDIVLQEIRSRQEPVVLDIGCGRGFDADPRLSASLAAASKLYLGIEPDRSITLQPIFSRVWDSLFEDAPIEPDSVDVAFCVMVVEHIENPKPFLEKVFEVLRRGGVFWAFTVDGRHWFPRLSKFAAIVHLKELYLNLTHGRRGLRRYENYPVHYRMNKPEHIEPFTIRFRSTLFLNFYRPGQLYYYYPRRLQRLSHVVDSISHGLGFPGSLLAIRLQK